MELELRHLRALCAIADAGSLGRAAAELGFAQPTISLQLQRIERFFGEALFVRGATGVTPTRYGVEVVSDAREVLARADVLGDRPTGGTRSAARTLRLAATNTPILPGLVRRVRAVLPELELTVGTVYSSADLVELVETGQLDVAVAADYPGRELRHSGAVALRGIVTEPAFLALPAGHRLARRTEIPLSDLAPDPWLLTPDDGAGWPGCFHDACAAAGFAPAAVHEFLGDLSQLQTLIADGLGVSIVQATFSPIDRVVVKPLAGTPLWCRYLLVWRKSGLPAAVTEALFGAARSAYRELIARSARFQSWAAHTYRIPGG